MRLEGKVALISGAARGIGAEEARLFAREGAKLAIGDVLEVEGRKVEAQIIETGGDALFVKLDVTREADWINAIQATVGRFGKLDILVNNAGIGDQRKVEEATEEWWDRIMDVNAKSVFLGTKHAIPEMRRAGGGSIVNTSSIYGLVGGSTSSSYSASKGAVHIFTKATAAQYARDGIRANSVHPGPTDSPMTEGTFGSNQELRETWINLLPLRRMGTTEDIAYGVLFLASDESSYMTGTELVVDGGFTAR